SLHWNRRKIDLYGSALLGDADYFNLGFVARANVASVVSNVVLGGSQLIVSSRGFNTRTRSSSGDSTTVSIGGPATTLLVSTDGIAIVRRSAITTSMTSAGEHSVSAGGAATGTVLSRGLKPYRRAASPASRQAGVVPAQILGLRRHQ